MPLIEDFPKDGCLYVLRGIRQVPDAMRSVFYPIVQARFQYLDPNALTCRERLAAAMISQARHMMEVTVPVGLLSYLTMSAIYRNGDIVDIAPWREWKVRALQRSECKRLYREAVASDIGNGGQGQPTSRKTLRHKMGAEHRDGDVLSLNVEQGIIRIPLLEVFRAFYGFHPRLAEAVVGAPWPTHSNRVFDVDWGRQFEEGRAKCTDPILVLRPGLPTSMAPNFFLAATEARWQENAKQLHAAFNSPQRKDADRSIVPPVEWPYTPENTTLRVRGFTDPRAKEVIQALEIVSFDWTGPETIWIRRDGPRQTMSSAARTRVDRIAEGHSGHGTIERPFGDPESISAFADPQTEAAPLNLPVACPSVDRGPTVARLPSVGPETPSSGSDLGSIKVSEGPSGVSRPIRTHRLEAARTAVRTRCSRFEEIMHVAERVRARGLIQSYEVLRPPRVEHTRSGLHVWTFPRSPIINATTTRTRRCWSRHVDQEGALHSRTALVLLMTPQEGAQRVSITIEPRNGESGAYCTLIFRKPQEQLEFQVRRLLEIGAARRGVWPNREDLARTLGIERSVKWKHWSRPSSADDGVNVDVVLSPDPFTRSILAA